MPLLTRIPHAPTAADAQPLKRVIRAAAKELGLSDYIVADALSYMIVQIAEEMAAGECVTLSGFGRFGAGIIDVRGTPTVFPQFYPSRALRNELKAVLTVARAQTSNDRMQSYRNSHRSGSRKNDRSRTFTAQQSWREILHAEERKRGGRSHD